MKRAVQAKDKQLQNNIIKKEMEMLYNSNNLELDNCTSGTMTNKQDNMLSDCSKNKKTHYMKLDNENTRLKDELKNLKEKFQNITDKYNDQNEKISTLQILNLKLQEQLLLSLKETTSSEGNAITIDKCSTKFTYSRNYLHYLTITFYTDLKMENLK